MDPLPEGGVEEAPQIAAKGEAKPWPRPKLIRGAQKRRGAPRGESSKIGERGEPKAAARRFHRW